MQGDLEVHLLREEEVPRWEDYMKRFHYLSLPLKGLPGELLRYVAILEGTWVALLAWSSAALKCAVRDKFIGWSEDKKLKRLKFVVNNVRFLILPWGRRRENLASRILALNLKRLSRDYGAIYGHPVYLAETFVDLSLYQGTSYRASNWIYLGKTKGYSKNGRQYYQNGKPKGVFIYPLMRDAEKILNADFLPEGGDSMNPGEVLFFNELPVEDLVEVIRKVTDPRDRRGIRYSIASLLGLAICAFLCGAKSFRAIGEWVQNLEKKVLKRFGIPGNRCPEESTLRRAIQRIEVEEFDRLLSEWLLSRGIRQ